MNLKLESRAEEFATRSAMAQVRRLFRLSQDPLNESVGVEEAQRSIVIDIADERIAERESHSVRIRVNQREDERVNVVKVETAVAVHVAAHASPADKVPNWMRTR